MMPEHVQIAALDDKQLKMLSELEDELGVTLVAYESQMHDTNLIVESDV